MMLTMTLRGCTPYVTYALPLEKRLSAYGTFVRPTLELPRPQEPQQQLYSDYRYKTRYPRPMEGGWMDCIEKGVEKG